MLCLYSSNVNDILMCIAICVYVHEKLRVMYPG
ncbi:hypothetical protein F383_34014 [Gossypium arboreum]|uniref:Uncharacterized protein n=1 Tax=Gossypium arboreum TaxID=29729 RepID=A0A0B0PN40_GOSAR|nr:hypothetical protein F383_34014 [Gossypium arboreum]